MKKTSLVSEVSGAPSSEVEPISINLAYIAALFIGIVPLHFIANEIGLYDTPFVWFDNVLHVMVGLGFGLLWLWTIKLKGIDLSLSKTLLSTAVFVLVLAIGWELVELGFFEYFTDYAYSLKVYSPSLEEATYDVVSNLLGIGLIPLIGIIQRRRCA